MKMAGRKREGGSPLWRRNAVVAAVAVFVCAAVYLNWSYGKEEEQAGKNLGDSTLVSQSDPLVGQQTGGAAVNQRHDDRADRHHCRADRQINAARNDDERHAQRDDAHARVVAQDVDPVSGKRRKPLAEGRIIKPQRDNLQNHHHQKRDSRRKQRFPLPVIGEPRQKTFFVGLFHSRFFSFIRISRRLPAA